MKIYHLVLFIAVLYFGIACSPQKTEQQSGLNNLQEDIPVHDFKSLEPLFYTKSEKTYVVNFWAIWCAPCVKELPIFQAFQKNNPDVEVMLISMDFPEDIEPKLKPFLKKHNINTKVVLLDDPDSNSWIDKVDPNWSGAIPFTIIFNNKNRSFHERDFKSLQDLEDVIYQTINNVKS